MSLNSELSGLFSTLAALMDLKGESPFKGISFSKVSRLLKETSVDIAEAAKNGRLKEIEGIGPSSQRIIEQYVAEGRSADFDEVAASVPTGLIPMLDIPGLGPKTLRLLWQERQITSTQELLQAIDAGKLEGLKGIGEKKIEAIKQGIQIRSQATGRMGIVQAMPIAQAFLEQLRKLPQIREAQIAGSLRRRRETIGDVDLLCSTKKHGDNIAVGDAFVKFPEVERILAHGPTKCSIMTTEGLQIDLRIVPAENFGAALLYFTGSKEHNTRIRGLALDHEMTLNEWGLYRLKDYDKSDKKPGMPPAAKPVASKTEAEIYKGLGLETIEPELREDRGEVQAAQEGKLPKLLQLKDIRGDLHSHTTASDGKASIEEMAQAAMEHGYQYLAVTDHSKAQALAHGLTVDRLMKHINEIRKVSDQIKGITLLAGCEVDILPNGQMDFEDAVLAELDFVVGSPHISLKQDVDTATDRLLRAIDNRYVNLIGHPTGRQIFQREGLSYHFARIIKAAADSGTALEINGHWPRFDLNDVLARQALEARVKISVDTDAHSTADLDRMEHGLWVARRAWITSNDLINCLPLADLRKFIKQKRG